MIGVKEEGNSRFPSVSFFLSGANLHDYLLAAKSIDPMKPIRKGKQIKYFFKLLNISFL
jgi:hypothetical protein